MRPTPTPQSDISKAAAVSGALLAGLVVVWVARCTQCSRTAGKHACLCAGLPLVLLPVNCIWSVLRHADKIRPHDGGLRVGKEHAQHAIAGTRRGDGSRLEGALADVSTLARAAVFVHRPHYKVAR